ncbi:hypothetical protein Mlute_00913 [Meiothermus luteus]|jgi:hypothetical protein|uniref:Uncharacterized protein n=1 Tax=Meiothermus luteus TaxID=2026184 RepID=A0A399EVC4_9DEIN|nr:hypothetical protein [Meiothermus luteus]RIH87603.1 hypothetical protein Mlute_00913 [Meiothermus luteus]RMH53997.1 MAG: hypothetical protein D6684_10795 [Deinococcota bacterium]
MTPEMLEFLKTLEKHCARYMVIGGYAVGFYGTPRHTKDLDLWVDPKEAPRLLEAIRDFFGGSDLGLTLEDLSTPGVVQLGYAPNRIDLVLMPTPDFDSAYEQSRCFSFEGQGIRVVDRKTLVELKRAFGRAIDVKDIEELEP